MSVLVIIVAAGLVGLAAGVSAGPWGWLAIMAFALVVYISVGTGRDVPPDWMATAVPAIPFAFIGVGIGISVRRTVRGDTSFASAFLAARPQSPSRPPPQELPSADDLVEALGALSLLLETDFDGADAYRRQLDTATLTRHAAGYRIAVDRSRAAAAQLDARRPGGRLPVEATGEDNLRIWLHGIEGYLDDLELLNASRFPHPATLQVRSTT